MNVDGIFICLILIFIRDTWESYSEESTSACWSAIKNGFHARQYRFKSWPALHGTMFVAMFLFCVALIAPCLRWQGSMTFASQQNDCSYTPPRCVRRGNAVVCSNAYHNAPLDDRVGNIRFLPCALTRTRDCTCCVESMQTFAVTFNYLTLSRPTLVISHVDWSSLPFSRCAAIPPLWALITAKIFCFCSIINDWTREWMGALIQYLTPDTLPCPINLAASSTPPAEYIHESITITRVYLQVIKNSAIQSDNFGNPPRNYSFFIGRGYIFRIYRHAINLRP